MYELAKKAIKSRKKGILGTIKNWFIPQQKEIMAYVEEMDAIKKVELAKNLTEEEFALADFISDF